MPSPALSVLMPVFNGERYLRSALDSVLVQSFRDFELIVVDDGSTDSTARILESAGEARLKTITTPHVGLIGALETGLARCSAPFIARMDADDLSRPNRFARQIDYISAHADCAIVTCESELVDENGRVVGRTSGGIGADPLLEFAAGNPIVHGSVMMRRAALPMHPTYVEPPEDYRLWVTLVRAGRRFHAIPEPLYAFRHHGERYSLSHATIQSRGIVAVQWPLLEECSASRDVTDPEVRARLVRGWGTVAGAAYRSGDRPRGDAARRRFLELVRQPRTESIEAAARHGIEAMIWGGCPWPQAMALRAGQCLRRPSDWRNYRNLLATLPLARSIRSLLRRGR